jgi:hypothetical protein
MKPPLNIVALFKTSKAFNIVGIGQVLTGQILEGEISVGNVLQLDIDGVTANYTIDAVEKVDYVSKGESEVGLIFDVATPELQSALENILSQSVKVTNES